MNMTDEEKGYHCPDNCETCEVKNTKCIVYSKAGRKKLEDWGKRMKNNDVEQLAISNTKKLLPKLENQSNEQNYIDGFIDGFQEAVKQLKNCANCENGKDLFNNGCLGCKIAQHTNWKQRKAD